MNIAELTRFKIMLLAHQEELREAKASAQRAVQSSAAEQSEHGFDSQQIQSIQARHQQDLLAQIESALSRISAGNYGNCLDCSQEINQHRLEIEPCAIQCDNCSS